MPITIQYGPAGIAGGLAGMAGAGEARRQTFSEGMQLSDLALRQNSEQYRQMAGDRAFALQSAMADRTTVAGRKSPAADHIEERADIIRADKAANQKLVKDQLDKMLASGTIDPSQYQKGLMAVMTGNEGLMQHILANPKATVEKPNISNAEEVDIIREPFREKRRQMQTQFSSTIKNVYDPAEVEKQKATLQASLDAEFTKEAAAIDQWRKQGRGKTTETPTPGSGSLTNAAGRMTSISSDTGALSGTGSMTATTPAARTPTNNSEQNILNILKGVGIKMPSWTPTTATATVGGSQQHTPPAAFPDAVWSDQHNMWTVIRNGRLMGVPNESTP
jgi:hypothetical protein